MAHYFSNNQRVNWDNLQVHTAPAAPGDGVHKQALLNLAHLVCFVFSSESKCVETSAAGFVDFILTI